MNKIKGCYGRKVRTLDTFGTVQLYKWEFDSPFKDKGDFLTHYCISVFDRTFEFTPDGIQTGKDKKKLQHVQKLGITLKTVNEYENWLLCQNTNYSSANFDFVDKNSATFAQECHEFLQPLVHSNCKTSKDESNETEANVNETKEYDPKIVSSIENENWTSLNVNILGNGQSREEIQAELRRLFPVDWYRASLQSFSNSKTPLRCKWILRVFRLKKSNE